MDSDRRRPADGDCLFLQNVLDKLYDFGKPAESKKRVKARKKNKLKHRGGDEEEEEEQPCVPEDRADLHQNPRRDPAGPRSQAQVEVIVFQDPRKRRRPQEPPAAPRPSTVQKTEETPGDHPEDLNLEKARLEVHRFGITGFKKEQQRVFEQDRAVMLGARPPKREYVNYRVLQQQIKEKKEKSKEDVQPDLKKKKKKQKSEKDRKTATSGSGAAPTGQMGRFKNGMLILSSSEIQKIKGKK